MKVHSMILTFSLLLWLVWAVHSQTNTAIKVKVTLDALHKMLQCQNEVDNPCQQCFNYTEITSVLDSDGHSETELHDEESQELFCSLILHRLIDFRAGCKTHVTPCKSLAECKTNLKKQLRLEGDPVTYHAAFERLHILFRQLKPLLRRDASPQSETTKCISSHGILEEMGLDRNGSAIFNSSSFVGQLSRIIVENIIHKEKCLVVDEAKEPFLKYLFKHYVDDKSKEMDFKNFERLLNDLKNPPSDSGNHDHGHHHHARREPNYSNKLVNLQIYETDQSSHHNHHDHDEDHDHNDDHDDDHKDEHDDDDDNDPEEIKTKKCLSVEEMLDDFGFLNYGHLTKSDFVEICPAMVQQVVSGACSHQTKDDGKSERMQTKWELYGYSTIAVSIISLTSVLVVIILPLLNKSFYQYLMMCMIGLAFGTMAGDALLHLIPQGLGLHSHGHGDSNDHLEEHEHDMSFIWRQLGIMAAIYGIFIFESVMEVISGGKMEEHHGHTHSFGGHGHSHMPDNQLSSDQKSPSKTELAFTDASSTSSDSQNSSKESQTVFRTPNVCCGLRSMAWVITLGDTIHNLGDGLAIGAAFSASTQSGISTSIAVLCHELPHEFGDFVVLLSTGLSFKKALLVNFMSAMSCFVGLYVGIAVGNDESTRLWIMIVTAGIFLYVALTEMLPELKQNMGKNRLAMFVMKNLGILSGVSAMVIIALYEDAITI